MHLARSHDCSHLFIADDDADVYCLQLKLMATVHQTQPNIQMLLATSDYVGALDLITATQDILTRDLAGIQSFRFQFVVVRLHRIARQ